MKHPIAVTRNGTVVYVDLVRSPAAAHIAAQPHLLGLIKEALERSNLKTPEVRMEHDMGRNIGYDFVTNTTEGDVVFYAQRVREHTYTRFIKNRKPHTTPYLTIVLQRDDQGEYEVRDTWIGRLCPPLPGSSGETADSKQYWNSHAHIFDKEPLQARTITTACPY